MKLNDFRHLCSKVYSKEVSFLCFVKFLALVFVSMLTKNDNMKTSTCPQYLATMRVKFHQKEDLGWVKGAFPCAYGHKQLNVKSSRFNHASLPLRPIFFMALPVLVIGCYWSVFSFHPDIKILFLKKHFQFAKFQENKT